MIHGDRRMNIFTEGSGSLVAGALIKSIKDAGMKVIASDITEKNAGFLIADDFVKLPKKDDPYLWEKIKTIITDYNIDWVVPSFDEMLYGWSQIEQEIIEEGANILISPASTISIFLDKWKTYNAFIQAGLPTPKTSLKKEHPMVKPRQGRGSVGIKVTDKAIPMENNISQELVEGTELTVDCLYDKNGSPIYIVPRIRLHVIDGKSVNGVTIKHEKVENFIKTLSTHFHFIGPINIQCFIKGEDLWFIEVNPRVGGGMALGWAATENWFDLWFNKIIHGKTFTPKPVQYGLTMYRYYKEIFTENNEIQSNTF